MNQYTIKKIHFFVNHCTDNNSSTTIQSIYSSELNQNSQIFPRIKSELLNYYFEAIEINVIETDCYDIINNSTFNVYEYIYKDNFDSKIHPSIFRIKDDSSLQGYQFQSTVRLQNGIIYLFIMTANKTNKTGLFSSDFIGPAEISFRFHF